MAAVATRPKLAAILSMMRSDHDGEVLAAARLAERIRRDMGASWGELLGLAKAPSPDWRTTVAACRAQVARLTEWESDFLDVLASYRHAPSVRQAETLANIAMRVL